MSAGRLRYQKDTRRRSQEMQTMTLKLPVTKF